MHELIRKRITKYERDIASHPAPSQPDGVCRCDQCRDARVVLKELDYLDMAERYERGRQLPRAGFKDGSASPDAGTIQTPYPLHPAPISIQKRQDGQ